MLASEKYHNLNSSSKRRWTQTREGTKMKFSALKKFIKDLRFVVNNFWNKTMKEKKTLKQMVK